MTTYTAPPNQNNLVLNNGDTLNVDASGQAFNTMNNGGVENVYSGGTDSGATINSGGGSNGLEYVYGNATDTTINSGLEFVVSGGTATHITINSGSALWVAGVAVDTTINSGGLEQILGDGLSSVVTFGGPNAILFVAGEPSALIGTISNWQVGDRIEFDATLTGVSQSGNTLTVTWGDNQTATYTLVGQQPNTEVKLQNNDLILQQQLSVGSAPPVNNIAELNAALQRYLEPLVG